MQTIALITGLIWHGQWSPSHIHKSFSAIHLWHLCFMTLRFHAVTTLRVQVSAGQTTTEVCNHCNTWAHKHMHACKPLCLCACACLIAHPYPPAHLCPCTCHCFHSDGGSVRHHAECLCVGMCRPSPSFSPALLSDAHEHVHVCRILWVNQGLNSNIPVKLVVKTC